VVLPAGIATLSCCVTQCGPVGGGVGFAAAAPGMDAAAIPASNSPVPASTAAMIFARFTIGPPECW
jgi:hypothetical protein